MSLRTRRIRFKNSLKNQVDLKVDVQQLAEKKNSRFKI